MSVHFGEMKEPPPFSGLFPNCGLGSSKTSKSVEDYSHAVPNHYVELSKIFSAIITASVLCPCQTSVGGKVVCSNDTSSIISPPPW